MMLLGQIQQLTEQAMTGRRKPVATPKRGILNSKRSESASSPVGRQAFGELPCPGSSTRRAIQPLLVLFTMFCTPWRKPGTQA